MLAYLVAPKVCRTSFCQVRFDSISPPANPARPERHSHPSFLGGPTGGVGPIPTGRPAKSAQSTLCNPLLPVGGGLNQIDQTSSPRASCLRATVFPFARRTLPGPIMLFWSSAQRCCLSALFEGKGGGIASGFEPLEMKMANLTVGCTQFCGWHGGGG